MPFTTTYRDANTFNFQVVIDFLRFIILNIILAIIFLFLAFEEIDWLILTSGLKVKDKFIDRTSWNLNNLFKFD